LKVIPQKVVEKIDGKGKADDTCVSQNNVIITSQLSAKNNNSSNNNNKKF